MKKHSKVLYFILIALAGIIFAYRKVWLTGMIFFADVIPFPKEATDAFHTFFLSWNPVSLGIESCVDLYYFLIGVFVFIFRDAVIAQKIFYFSPLFIGAVGMYLLLGRFIKYESPKYLASFLYAVNPISSYGGPPGPFALFYSLYPFMALFLLKIIDGRKVVQSLLLFSVFMSLGVFFSLQSLVIFFPFIIIALLLEYLVKKDIKTVAFSVTVILTSLFIVFLLTLPLSFFVFSNSQKVMDGESIGRLLGDVEITYSQGTILRLVRMAGLYSGSPEFLGYNSTSLWTYFGYILPILAFGSLIIVKDKKKRKIAILFSSVAIFIILQVWMTYKGWTSWIFKTFPVLLIFRNPKLMTILPLTYCPLIALGFEEMQNFFQLDKFKKRWLIKTTAFLLIISAVGIYSWPFFTGDMAISRALKLYKVNWVVPETNYEIGKWLKRQRQQEGYFRTVWLPFDSLTHQSIRWIDPYVFSSLIGVERTSNLPIVKYIHFIYEALCDKQTDEIGSLAAPANIRYFIVRLESEQKGDCRLSGLYPQGSPEKFISLLNEQKDLKLIEEQEDFLIYENKQFIPHIAVYERISFIIEGFHSSFPSVMPMSVNGNQPLFVFGEGLNSKETKWFLNNIVSSNIREIRGANIEERPYSYKVVEINETEYYVEVKTKKPVYIVLGESYHPSWSAYVNGQKLKHFKASYWANGFYLDKIGNSKVKIIFEKQKVRNKVIRIWMVSWILLVMAIIYTSKGFKKKKRG